MDEDEEEKQTTGGNMRDGREKGKTEKKRIKDLRRKTRRDNGQKEESRQKNEEPLV